MNSASQNKEELCDIVRKFITSNTEENNKNMFKLIEVLKENEKLREELDGLKNKTKNRDPFDPPSQEMLVKMLSLRDLMRYHRVPTVSFAGITAAISDQIQLSKKEI
jgi:hypothetical protein